MAHKSGTKWDKESAIIAFKEKGFTMVNPDEFVDSKHKVSIYDSEGYWYYISLFSVIHRDYGIRVFHSSNPYTIKNISFWVSLNNKSFRLLDGQEYKRASRNLKWQCLKEDCNEIFEATWNDIIVGNGCSYCRGLKVGISNCLATKNPNLAKQWHPTLNGDLTPYDVTCGSRKIIWWQCPNNLKHIWKAEVDKRNHKNDGCPYCSGNLPSEDYNLLICNPELCEEWDYDKNEKRPEEYTPYSKQKVWWVCKECGYEWKASIGCRNGKNKTGCPECNQSKGELQISKCLNSFSYIKTNQDNYSNINNLDNMSNYYIPQKEFEDLLGLGGKHLSYDFYLPQYNLLIEYQGIQHEKYIPGFHKSKKDFEKQLEHDKRKKEYAQNNNINLLEIWYYDFDNIETILKNELKI